MQRGRSREDARRGSGIGPSPRSVAAIVPAAGSGERARRSASEPPKQFLTLQRRPLLTWAVDAVIEAGCSPVILVVPDGHEDMARAIVRDLDVVVVRGGATRQVSVGNGLQEVDTEAVVVHDAARPFASSDLVRCVIDALDDAEAVLAAVPVDETLKRLDDDERVVETIDRSVLWRAQTPAAFRTSALRDAHRKAAAEGFTGTDESQLVERYGGTVRIVPGRRDNLKVTFPEDLRLAEAMVSLR
ncbi:MAG TPA: 2-C-methyl-D-erythritol 4-phosphate cytidylyltransferase [Actinomycetota bacterium]|nr:2-C-methyl-D-erythritol 4-phosphate cytidylyltransferase [Actinomycetota bacterium]